MIYAHHNDVKESDCPVVFRLAGKTAVKPLHQTYPVHPHDCRGGLGSGTSADPCPLKYSNNYQNDIFLWTLQLVLPESCHVSIIKLGVAIMGVACGCSFVERESMACRVCQNYALFFVGVVSD